MYKQNKTDKDSTLNNTQTYNFRFPNQDHDTESSFDFNHQRYYMQDLMIYAPADPLCMAASSTATRSLFTYAGKNPVNFSKPSGLATNLSKDDSLHQKRTTCT